MKIDGRQIAEKVFQDLKSRVGELKKNDINPHLAVILVGDDPASTVYVLQKQLRGKEIEVNVEVVRFPSSVSSQTLIDKIRDLNLNSQIHGIIVQRPLPEHINPDMIEDEIADRKDADGFKAGSPYYVPLVLAVIKILEEISQKETGGDFINWLKSKKIALLGKGSTAGQPIIDYLKEIGVSFEFIDSSTENPKEITQKADIIISSVGKEKLITPDMIKMGVILIGVGINRNAEGQLHGDYDEEAIKDIASSYTPTPKGVGPINVAMLLENLLAAAEKVGDRA